MRPGYFLKGLGQSARLLREGRFRVLAGKLKHRIPVRQWPAVRSETVWSRIPIAADAELVLIVDAGSGGGSTQYRDRLIQSLNERGKMPVRLEFDLRSGHALLRWSEAGPAAHDAPAEKGVQLRDYRCLDAQYLPRELAAVSIGTMARFPNAPDLMARLGALVDERDLPLTIDWHDHFLLCPVASLMGMQDYFCGLPEPDVCAACLPKNGGTFDRSLNLLSIETWRASGAALLSRASIIRVFSHSSAELLRRVYGDRFDQALCVMPHSMDYFSPVSLPGPSPALRTIGIIGQIGLHKGAALVLDLAREIRRRGMNLRIVIVGTLEVAYPRDLIRETGAYEQAALPQILQREKVDLVLFPSVCPETFSFVVHEVIALGLPLATLPLGAQAEYVGPYFRGLVLEGPDPGAALEAMEVFAQQGYEQVPA